MQSITLELDDETIRSLALIGEPAEVLVRLADSAAIGARRQAHVHRDHTDESLRIERDAADARVVAKRLAEDEVADRVVRLARRRADQLMRTARDDADPAPQSPSTSTEALADSARTMLEHERSDADAVLGEERAQRARHPDHALAGEREATDQDLSGERSQSDSLIVDQREANEQMVRATLRAQELAAEADEARGRAEESARELRSVAEFREMFIGILGHDLRNPLWAITIATGELLRRGRLDEKDGAMVVRIVNSSQRMGRMIAQLLDLTRARLGGGLPIELEPADLREICAQVADEFDADVELAVEGDATGTWDRDRLAEALSNLVGNAIEHAAPDTAVTVAARADGADLVVEVSNRGEPIPADLVPFIFEPFRRAHQHTKSNTGNLGLGLYIAQQIVLAHGGTLTAQSEEGKTTFVMRLPRQPRQSERPPV